jgi:FkbM family methyltransferase
MYKLKGRKIQSVKFLSDQNAWEFKIDGIYLYSTGPGWSYDLDFLTTQFKSNLGYYYLPQPGDVVIDVGAGVGEEMIVLAKLVGKGGKVIAVEAHPTTFKTLARNKELNRLDNVYLVNNAISDAPGHIFIQDAKNSLANKVSGVPEPDSFKVEAITFDALVARHGLPRIDFVKVNIEGAEQLLVKGLNEALPKISRMAVSCHDFRYHAEGDPFFKTKSIIVAYFQDHGFNVQMRETHNSLLDDYVYATSPSLKSR